MESREVVLPPGRWYDFYSGELAGEEEVITITPGLDHIPLFVKDGAIIPMLAEERTRMPEGEEKLDLEIRVYGNQAGSFELYDDDGESFNYEQGEYSLTELKVDLVGQSLRPSMLTKKEGYFSYFSHPEWVFMTE